MIDLLLSVLFNSMIFIFFKWISAKEVNTYRIVVINYLIAAGFGFLLDGSWNRTMTDYSEWLMPTILVGATFVGVFYLIAYSTKQIGAGRTVISTKLSLIIPVVLAYFLYGDKFNSFKVFGVLLSIPGIYLLTIKRSSKFNLRTFYLVVSLFIATGFLDSSIKFIQHNYLVPGNEMLFTSLLFLFAFLTGLLSFLIVKGNYEFRKIVIDLKFGFILGIVNVGSIFFLVRALQHPNMASSVVFPLNNLLIIFLTTLVAILLFKEEIKKKMWFGFVISILSMVLLILSNYF